MPCARQVILGLPDNCASCKALRPDLYNPCQMHPERVKLPVVEKSKPEMVIIPVKELSYEEAKKEVMDYIQTKGGKVSISEIVEKLRLDIEVVAKILEE